ncbi:E3 ubiquitin-protein ligase CBLL2 [Hylobates moloch]|uniref:E3 ubiquitin-protein ligase CBLL2 n=1 Tax=Hylobates moloch TaxID=81572 RepID=UPI0013F23407|nr:E3 ubiquitin-protein ligase CBLL2 [Hylobates moloch]
MNKMPAGEQECEYNKEGKYYSKGVKLVRKRKRIRGSRWGDIKINIIGEKDDSPIHFCDKCDLPIKIYGRIIPCKHAFCYNCANLYHKIGYKICPRCSYPVLRIEAHKRGSVFMCSVVQGCKRTYLSQKSLQAHIKRRHKRARKQVTSASFEKVHPHIAPPRTEISEIPKRLLDRDHLSYIPPEQHTMMSLPSVQHMLHEQHNRPHEDIQAPAPEPSLSPPFPIQWETVSIFTRKHGNLTVDHIQNNSDPGAKKPTPPDYYPEYQSQPAVSSPHHIIPQKQHYAPPPSPSSPINHPMPYPPQDVVTPNLVRSQVPALTTTYDLSSRHIIVQVPPYMNSPPPCAPQSQNGNPSASEFAFHHYNPNFLPQFTENQETLSPQFTQTDAMDHRRWPAQIGLPPCPPMQSPPPSTLHGGSHHSYQRRHRPY